MDVTSLQNTIYLTPAFGRRGLKKKRKQQELIADANTNAYTNTLQDPDPKQYVPFSSVVS